MPGGLISLLPDCPDLRRLNMDGSRLTPEALERIGAITQLEELSLARCFVKSRTQAPPFLDSLRGLGELQQLDLTGFHMPPLSGRDRERLELMDGEFRDWMDCGDWIGLQTEEVSHRRGFPAANLRSIYEARRGTPAHCARTR